jgi:hypothetical protein
MSLSIDSTAVLIEHYHRERNLQTIVEITTSIGWAHGFVNYPKVYLLMTGDTMAT